MNVYGLRYLDKNEYNAITIDKDIITISGEVTLDPTKPKVPFSDNLKGLDGDSRVDQVVDYFLKNNRITFMNNSGFCTIFGNESRLLRFKNEPSSDNRFRLFERYLSNRKETLKKIKVREYIIENTVKMSAYSVIHKDVMRLVLSMKDGKYLKFERDFIKDLLDEVFKSEVEIKTLYHKDENGNDTKEVDGTFIVGEHPRGCRIRITSNDEIIKAVERHNEKIKKEREENEFAKTMQLKLEGF